MTPQASGRPPRATLKLWLFRTLAFAGIPGLLFLGLETGLRLAGVGRPASFMIPDDQPGYFRTNQDFSSLFLPPSFDRRPLNFRVAARKPPGTVRIVVLGESVAQGIPVPAFAFAPQLRAQLRARYPGKVIEVLNTGIVAINSHVVYQIARDLAGFSPDLFVVYLGNNEVVGPYGPGCTYLSEMPPLWVIRLSVFVRSTRTGQLLTALLGRMSRQAPGPVEWGGMAMFVDSAVSGDDPRLEEVYRNFEANLRDIVGVAAGAGAKTLLCTVVSNLKDCAPLLSLHRPGLSAAELATWQRVFDQGKLEWKLGEAAPAGRDLAEAWRIDPHYADTAFMLGSLELQAGNTEAGRRHLLAAQHWDALRFRPDPRLNEVIRRVAREQPAAVSLVDAAVLLGSDPASSAPPPGRELFFEHVHFDWAGNYQLARLLAPAAEGALLDGAPPRPSWLDAAGCAAALGYTAHERLSLLQRVAPIIRNPPFTNQLTYGEDQARLVRDLARAQADSREPEILQHAKAVVQAAAASDPENPALAKLAEDLADDLGDLAGALAQAQRGRQLQPNLYATATDEAIKLARLGRFAAAEKLLRQTAATCSAVDQALMAPAFADFFVRTRRYAEGRRYFDAAVARRPADSSLRLIRGRLARSAGDTEAAAREFRAVLEQEPENPNALEALVSLLDGLGQTAGAETASLAAAEQQPKNQANNFRVAAVHEARGDEPGAIRFLLAAGRSGPMTAAIEARLAQKIFHLGRVDEALTHLAEAKRISIFEGDPAVTESIGQIIAQLQAERH